MQTESSVLVIPLLGESTNFLEIRALFTVKLTT